MQSRPATRHARRHAVALGAALFAGGAVFAATASFVTRTSEVDVTGARIIVVVSALTALAFWLGRDRVGDWAMLAGVAAGVVLITCGVYVNGERDGGPAMVNEVYYVWPVVFAAYYLSDRALATAIGLVAVCYAAVLVAIDPGAVGVSRWLMVVSMLAGVGGLISRLQHRLDELFERLSDTARRDPLTGLLNRRGLEQLVEEELSRATRSGRPVTLVLGDIDYFKRVNDHLGHPTGDAALLRTARVLERVARRGDTVARLGGEEFVLVAPNADAEAGLALAERARDAVQKAFALDPIPLTASFGVVAFPADGVTAEDLLATADRALYAAKGDGRNRCKLAAAPLLGDVAPNGLADAEPVAGGAVTD